MGLTWRSYAKMNCSESIYGRLNLEPRWYALMTRHHHEKKVNDRLQRKGITCYLPLRSTYHDWSDRKQKVLEPLFSCYLFVNMALKERFTILQTDGVIRLVSFNHVPVPIPEKQINSIRRLLGETLSIEKVDYVVGQEVEVIGGPLKGIQGVLQKIKGHSTRLVIAIEAFRQGIAVEIDACLVRPISEH